MSDNGNPAGNLYRGNFPTEFMEDVWDGCAHRDCLPACNTVEGHCERLKREYDEWVKRTPTIQNQNKRIDRP